MKLFICRGNSIFGYQLVLIKGNGTILKKQNNSTMPNKQITVTSKDLRQVRNEINLARKITTKPNYRKPSKLIKKISCR